MAAPDQLGRRAARRVTPLKRREIPGVTRRIAKTVGSTVRKPALSPSDSLTGGRRVVATRGAGRVGRRPNDYF